MQHSIAGSARQFADLPIIDVHSLYIGPCHPIILIQIKSQPAASLRQFFF
jgi:hypothetical protein